MMNSKALTLNSYGSLSVTTTPAKLNISGSSAIITNHGAADIFMGNDSSVDMNNGFPLAPGESIFINSYDVYFVVETGSADLRYIEAS